MPNAVGVHFKFRHKPAGSEALHHTLHTRMLVCFLLLSVGGMFAAATSSTWVASKSLGDKEPAALQASRSTVALSFGGSVEVYKWDVKGEWNLSQTLTSNASQYDGFGLSLSLHSLTMIVGAPYTLVGATSNGGGAFIFRRASESQEFVREAALQPPTSYVVSSFDSFGFSVSTVTDNFVAIASRSNGGRGGGGSVFLYARVVSTSTTTVVWALLQTLTPPSSAATSFFGSSLACTAPVIPSSTLSPSSSAAFPSALLAVGAPYYQTDYVPWPFVSSTSPATAELYALVNMRDDFTTYANGTTLAAGSAVNSSSLWQSVSRGTVRSAGTIVGACNLTSPGLVFASGSAGSTALTVKLPLPTSGVNVTVALRYCATKVSGSTDVTLSLTKADGSTTLLHTFTHASYFAAVTAVSLMLPTLSTSDLPIQLSISQSGSSPSYFVQSVSIVRTGASFSDAIFSYLGSMPATPIATAYSTAQTSPHGSVVRASTDAISGLPIVLVGCSSLVTNTSNLQTIAAIWPVTSSRTLAAPFVLPVLEGNVPTQTPLYDHFLTPYLLVHSAGFSRKETVLSGMGTAQSIGQAYVYERSLATSPSMSLALTKTATVAQTETTERFGSTCVATECFVGPGSRAVKEYLTCSATDGVYSFSCTDCNFTQCQLPDGGIMVQPQNLVLLQGTTASYNLTMLSPPLEGVSVVVSANIASISPPDSLAADLITLQPSVTFTTANWTTTGVIKLTAPNSTVFHGNYTFSIASSVSASGDGLFHGNNLATVYVQYIDTVSPSPTPTCSPSTSATPSGSRTISATVTVTTSRTPTFTVTSTVTTTATTTSSTSATATRTVSVTPTITATTTASQSATATVTASASATVSLSVTPTASRTVTVSRTATITSTATATPPPTTSVTPTVTRTPTQTISESRSVTGTPTKTTSPTPSNSAPATVTPTTSPTRSQSRTPSPTASLSFGSSPSITPSISQTISLTSSVSISASMSTSPTSSRSHSPSASGTPPATASISMTPTTTVTTTTTPTTTVTTTATRTTTPSPSVTPSTTGSGSVTPSVTGSTSATRSATATISTSASVSATASGTATVSPSFVFIPPPPLPLGLYAGVGVGSLVALVCGSVLCCKYLPRALGKGPKNTLDMQAYLSLRLELERTIELYEKLKAAHNGDPRFEQDLVEISNAITRLKNGMPEMEVDTKVVFAMSAAAQENTTAVQHLDEMWNQYQTHQNDELIASQLLLSLRRTEDSAAVMGYMNDMDYAMSEEPVFGTFQSPSFGFGSLPVSPMPLPEIGSGGGGIIDHTASPRVPTGDAAADPASTGADAAHSHMTAPALSSDAQAAAAAEQASHPVTPPRANMPMAAGPQLSLGEVPCAQCGVHLPDSDWARELHSTQVCQQRDVKCPLCSATVQAFALTKHQLEGCRGNRTMGSLVCCVRAPTQQCRFCKLSFAKSLLIDHVKYCCPKRPVLCLYGCGKRIPAMEVENHVTSGQCMPLKYTCPICKGPQLFTSFELTDHRLVCKGPHAVAPLQLPDDVTAVEPLNVEHTPVHAFSSGTDDAAAAEAAHPRTPPPQLLPDTPLVPAQRLAPLNHRAPQTGAPSVRGLFSGFDSGPGSEMDFIAMLAEQRRRRNNDAAIRIARALAAAFRARKTQKRRDEDRVRTLADRRRESDERLQMADEEAYERHRLATVRRLEAQIAERELYGMAAEEFATRRRMRVEQKAKAEARICEWAHLRVLRARALVVLQRKKFRYKAAARIQTRFRYHSMAVKAKRELATLKRQRDIKAAAVIKRAWKAWKMRMAGQLILQERREGLRTTADIVHRQAVALKAKCDRLQRETTRQQDAIAGLRKEVDRLGSTLAHSKKQCEQQAEVIQASQATVQSLQAQLDVEVKARAALECQLTAARGEAEAYRRVAEDRLHSMQAAWGARDDVLLHQEEAKLEQRRAHASMRKWKDKHKAGVERVRSLDGQLSGANHAVSRAAEYIKNIQNQSALQAKEAKAQMNEMSLTLVKQAKELEAARQQSTEATQRADDLQEELILAQMARETMELQLSRVNEELKAARLFSDDVQRELGVAGKDADVVACPLNCGGTILASLLETHRDQHCPNRWMTCKLCGKAMTWQDHSFHVLTCAKCEWCGQPCQGAEDKARHKLEECLNRLVKCNECDILDQYSGIPFRFMSEHRFHFCGGRHLNCGACGAGVAVRDAMKHSHRDCPALQGFNSAADAATASLPSLFANTVLSPMMLSSTTTAAAAVASAATTAGGGLYGAAPSNLPHSVSFDDMSNSSGVMHAGSSAGDGGYNAPATQHVPVLHDGSGGYSDTLAPSVRVQAYANATPALPASVTSPSAAVTSPGGIGFTTLSPPPSQPSLAPATTLAAAPELIFTPSSTTTTDIEAHEKSLKAGRRHGSAGDGGGGGGKDADDLALAEQMLSSAAATADAPLPVDLEARVRNAPIVKLDFDSGGTGGDPLSPTNFTVGSGTVHPTAHGHGHHGIRVGRSYHQHVSATPLTLASTSMKALSNPHAAVAAAPSKKSPLSFEAHSTYGSNGDGGGGGYYPSSDGWQHSSSMRGGGVSEPAFPAPTHSHSVTSPASAYSPQHTMTFNSNVAELMSLMPGDHEVEGGGGGAEAEQDILGAVLMSPGLPVSAAPASTRQRSRHHGAPAVQLQPLEAYKPSGDSTALHADGYSVRRTGLRGAGEAVGLHRGGIRITKEVVPK